MLNPFSYLLYKIFKSIPGKAIEDDEKKAIFDSFWPAILIVFAILVILIIVANLLYYFFPNIKFNG
jgi:hypothetical protein